MFWSRRAEPIEYHWVISYQWRDDEDTLMHSCADGTVPLFEGATRKDAFLKIREFIAEEFGATNIVVLAFTLEPNRLPA